MPSIFLSYRPSDAPGHAGRLHGRLVERFGTESVIADVDGVERCDVLVTVIGPNWLGPGDHGQGQLDDPYDPVRLAVGDALRRRIRIVSVLVHGAAMPPPTALPEDLLGLTKRQMVTLTDAAWDTEITQLLDGLAKPRLSPRPNRSSPREDITDAETTDDASRARADEEFPRRVGDYDVGRRLGRGAFGTVFLARHVKMLRLAALKELNFGAHDNTGTAERFLTEAQIAGSLTHPNIVVVYDYFERDGTAYIAMQCYPRGPVSLPSLTPAQRFGVLDGILAGLSYAADRNVVHRDLKPPNLLVGDDGQIKIVDFGIAKALDATADLGLSHGRLIGTPAFMAPEQALQGQISPRTDLYSTGVIAFLAFTGALPFDQTLPALALANQHAHTPPPRADEIDPDIDPRLADWIDALLAKDPGQRPENARVARDELATIATDLLGTGWRDLADLTLPAADEPVKAQPAPAPPAPPARADVDTTGPREPADPPLSPEPEGLSASGFTKRRQRAFARADRRDEFDRDSPRGRARVVVAALVLIPLLAVAAVWNFTREHDGEKPPPKTATTASPRAPAKRSPLIAWALDGEIHVVHADGTGSQQLTHKTEEWSDEQPSFSPDGQNIAWVRSHSLFAMRVDGAGVRRLTKIEVQVSQDSRPAWSPSGNQLVFVNDFNGALYVVSPDSSSQSRITDFGRDVHDDKMPAWTPDGSAIVFARLTRNASFDVVDQPLYTVASSGGTPRKLLGGSGQLRYIVDFALSPDGEYIAVVASRDDYQDPETTELWIASRSGESPTRIEGDIERVQYLADGTLLAIKSSTRNEVVSVDAASGATRNATNDYPEAIFEDGAVIQPVRPK